MMSNMGDTFTGTIVAAGKTAGRHKGKVISGSSLAGTMAVLMWLGINPLDFIVENSSAYQQQVEIFETEMGQLQFENRILLREIQHSRHIVESQNFMLRKMFQAQLINIDEYTSMIHAIEHERDSL